MATISTLAVNLIARTAVFERKMRKSQKTVHRFAQTVVGLGQTMLYTYGSYKLIRSIESSIRAFAEFEEQIAMVNTMLDKQTAHYMPQYADELKKLSMRYGEATSTLAKGLYDILSASIAPEKAIKVLNVAVKAAKAGFTDTAVAADAITTILNSYGRSAEDAMWASDVLFATVKRGKTTFAELAPNIGKVLAVAATAGLRFEEVGAALATMTRAGLRTEIAVTALRSILSTFLTPTAASIEVAKQLGLELNTTTLRTIGLTGVLKKLRNATAEQIAQLIPNIRGLAGFSAALKQVDDQLYDLNLMMESAGRTQEAYEKATDTLAHQFSRLGKAIKIVGIETGEAISHFVLLRPIVGGLTDKIEDLLEVREKYGKIGPGPLTYLFGPAPLAINIIRDIAGALSSSADASTEAEQSIEKLGATINKTASSYRYLIDESAAAQESLRINTESIERMNEILGRREEARPRLQGLFEEAEFELETLRRTPLQKEIYRAQQMLREGGFYGEELAQLRQGLESYIAIITEIDNYNKKKAEQIRLEQQAAQVISATRTPLEKYEGQIGRLHELLEAGVLNWETYGRAINLARKELEGIKAPRLPELQEIRPSQVSIPAMNLGLNLQNTELQKQTGILEQININTRKTAFEGDIG